MNVLHAPYQAPESATFLSFVSGKHKVPLHDALTYPRGQMQRSFVVAPCLWPSVLVGSVHSCSLYWGLEEGLSPKATILLSLIS